MTTASDVFPLASLLGGYRLEGPTADGATASLFRAIDPKRGQPVALKVFRRAESGRAAAEADILRRVAHSGIPRILGVGDGDTPYIVMDWIEGQSLRDLMGASSALSVESSVRLVRNLCEVLAHVHDQGIAHLDLKPEHILVDGSERVSVVDFGASRPSRSLLSLLMPRERTGTPDYASPEQISGKLAGVRSDVYSTGLIFYEMLTGELPFAGVAPNVAVNLRLHRDPMLPGEINPNVPDELQKIVCRAIDRNPARRYANARELCIQLDRYLETAMTEPVELFD